MYLEGSGEIDVLDQTHEYWVGVLRELMVEACNQLRQVQVIFGICSTCGFVGFRAQSIRCEHEARTVDGGHSSPALRPLQPDAVDRHRPPSEDATDDRLHFRGRDILTTPPKRVSGPVLQFGESNFEVMPNLHDPNYLSHLKKQPTVLIHHHDITGGEHSVSLVPHVPQDLLLGGLLIVDVWLNGNGYE